MRLPRLAWLILWVGLELWFSRRAGLSPVERVELAGLAAATLGAASLVLGLLGLRWRWGFLAAPILILWPLRWYSLLRTVFTLLACSAAAGDFEKKRALAGVVLLSSLTALLVIHSANLRFVAFEQTAFTSALLDPIARLLPRRSPAGARPTAQAGMPEDLPVLGDAHIVLVTIDALRADRPLSSLPSGGLRFSRAYAQAPSTALSLSSLFAATPPDDLGGAPPTVVEKLRARGWRTEAFYPAGLFFDGRSRLERYARTRFGFAWTDTRTLDAAALTDAVLARIARLRDEGEPRTFLWVHYFDAHEPYVEHPGLTRGRSSAARYDGEVAFVDRELARLIAGLSQLSRPVILCVTADHGEELGDHGGAYHNSSLYDEQVRVPLTLFASGLDRAIDEPVELTDVAPALLALAGEGPPPSFAHDVHSQVGTKRMLVRGNLKLIHDLERDTDELYDLSADPREQHNQFSELAAPLHAALEQYFRLASPDSLERALADAHAPPTERAAAARELGELLAFSARPRLRAALADPDDTVRAEAALALGQMTDRPALPTLTLLTAREEYRHRAALALGRLRDPRATPFLVETLTDIDPEKRRLAAHYLGFLGDRTSLAALEKAAADPRVRAEAEAACARIRSRLE